MCELIRTQHEKVKTMVTYKTNNRYRELIRWYELNAKEQAEFSWLDTEEKQMDEQFIRYKGRIYAMGEFMRFNYPGLFRAIDGWHAYQNDSYSSGIVIAVHPQDSELIKIGTFFS